MRGARHADQRECSNRTGSVAALAGRNACCVQVFCPVVRMLKLRPDIAVPTMTVPGSPTLVTVSGSTLVEPGETVPKSRVAPLTPPSTNRPATKPFSSTAMGFPPRSLRLMCQSYVPIDTGEYPTTRVQLFSASRRQRRCCPTIL